MLRKKRIPSQMKNRFNSLIEAFTNKPKKLFLVDGLGAVLTAFLLVVFLIRYVDVFGMPQKPLYVLSIIAVIYAVYSICCYFFIGKHWRSYLKLIAFANLLYCCATISFVIYFYPSVTIFGLIYFLAELVVIGCLVTIELMTAYHHSANQ